MLKVLNDVMDGHRAASSAPAQVNGEIQIDSKPYGAAALSVDSTPGQVEIDPTAVSAEAADAKRRKLIGKLVVPLACTATDLTLLAAAREFAIDTTAGRLVLTGIGVAGLGSAIYTEIRADTNIVKQVWKSIF